MAALELSDIEPPACSPPGLRWSKSSDGRVIFMGRIGRYRRCIVSQSLGAALEMAHRMERGEA